MKKFSGLVMIAVVILLGGVGSVRASYDGEVTCKVKRIEPQGAFSGSQPSPQLLVLDCVPEAVGCQGNNFAFFSDEPVIGSILLEARREEAEVRVTYQSSLIARSTYIESIGQSVCRIVGVGLASPAITILKANALILK